MRTTTSLFAMLLAKPLARPHTFISARFGHGFEVAYTAGVWESWSCAALLNWWSTRADFSFLLAGICICWLNLERVVGAMSIAYT
jgi:hypothetical protein